MGKLILLFVLLLTAAPGWAEPHPSPSCQIDEAGPKFSPGPDGNCHAKDEYPKLLMCHQRMEEAMRLVDLERAMVARDRAQYSTVTVYEGTSEWYIQPDQYNMTPPYQYVPDRRTDEERLADKQRDLDKEKVALQERRIREADEKIERQAAKALQDLTEKMWATVKAACWGKP